MIWSIVNGSLLSAGFKTTDKIKKTPALINSLIYRAANSTGVILNMNNID